jgi:hypothetical protein
VSSPAAAPGFPAAYQMMTTESGRRRVTVSVAEALRTRFPLDTDTGRRPPRLSVAEALRVRFPHPRTPTDGNRTLASAAGRTLPRRVRNKSAPATQARLASPELLRRVLDGLQKL